MIPYGRQTIAQEDIDAVVSVLQSDFLTQGPCVPAFESLVARYCGASHATAVNSATSALHIACMALELGPDDWLWTSPITFVASANCARYCGAKVDFVDIDPKTFNMCADALAEKLALAEKNGRLPKIVVPVHMAGQSCDMQRIHALSLRYKFHIIEDASHAIGGKYLSRPVGSCQFSDITVFSFHPVKIITTAEGGVAVTNNPVLAQRMELYRSHGVTRHPDQMENQPEGPWYYEQVTLGYNYRMTELQAALGVSQMQRLDQYVERRHVLAARYDTLLSNTGITLPYRSADSYSSFHLYILQLPDTVNRKAVFDYLRHHDVGVNVHYIPVHTQPYYARLGHQAGYTRESFPCANYYYQHALSIPLFFTLTFEQQDRVVQLLKESL